MIFLIEYDRSLGVVESMRSFPDSARRTAEDERLKLERALNEKGVSREVVLLEAPNEEALRGTHKRYFENLVQLMRSSATATT